MTQKFDKDKIRLIALDLDDTIIEHGIDISPATLSAIGHMHNRGVTVAIATGRLIKQIPPVLRNSPYISYLVASNGGVIFDNKSKKQLFQSVLEKEQVKEIIRIGNQTGAGIFISLEEISYCDIKTIVLTYRSIRVKYSRAQRKEASKLYKFKMLPPLGQNRFILNINKPIYKVSCLYKNEEIKKTKSVLYKDVEGVSAVSVSGNGLEITSDQATKGIAISFLCREMGILKKNVLTFGDSGNDISMRDYSGTFVAMGNASPEVKEIADFITGTVTEDGVATFLLRNMHK